YQEYFSILDNINAPKDKKYLEQYIQFLRSETNSMFLFISDENLKKGIRISKRMKLDNSDKGDVEFNFAGIYASRSDHKNARKYYKKSIQSYNQEHGNSHYTIAASLIEMLKLDLKEINQYIVTAQNDLLYKRRTAEKKIIRKARKLLTLAEEKVVKITPMLINQNENSPRLSDSFIQAKETVDDYHDKFSTHAYSDEVYKFAKKQVHSDSEEKSEYTITPIVRKNPIYPNRAAKTGLEGYVLSQFDIELDGTTSNIRVVESSHDIFIRYALYATSKYLYETPMINGLPSKIKNVTVRVDFNLKNNDEQKEGDQI
ncbi:MAG: energy transducer TonB, partial [Emcibacteraceae bacterium]|nr:energy transducer TonB [Emcibacteraceae bacterium]